MISILTNIYPVLRWDGEKEWNDQYTNYQMIIDHVNSNPRLNAKIQWGTLTDYFKAGPVEHEFILLGSFGRKLIIMRANLLYSVQVWCVGVGRA